ncbi:MAG TPA: peptidoglycan-binding domain-containing protein [Elainellaceae cyanobacterium]|jgi:peptidoglycan hydrolase-like protein with peptidoglycan-binding domain
MHSTTYQFNRPVLRFGSRHPIVIELQQRLSQQGRPIALTGIFDQETEIAVKYFQSRFFLGPDGVVGPLTWQALCKEAPPHTPTLSQGSSGDAVIALQELLSIDLYYCGAIDGIFGHMMMLAVRRFQNDYGLLADGVVDPKTWQALSEL